jgi:hypothetical protein
MLFDIQFLNDLASANSKERQFGEELYSSEVKHQPADGIYRVSQKPKTIGITYINC